MGYVDQVFELAKQGSKVSQKEFYDRLTPKLFDYVMRMTGREPDSQRVIDEAVRGLMTVGFVSADPRSEIFHVFKIVRARALDFWGAETGKLVNRAYKVLKDEDLPRIERLLRGLSPIPRECILLTHRYGFSPEEVMRLVTISREDFDVELLKGNQRLGIKEKEHSEQILKLLDFPTPDQIEQGTVALSAVMKGVKKSGEVPWKWMGFFIVLFLAVMVASGFYVFKLAR